MTCPRCGRSNPESAGQCAACGAALSPDAPTLAATGAGRSTPRTGAGSDRTLTTGGRASGFDASGSGARLAPGTLLGTRYEILAVLGEGGMGTVYKAQDRELRRLVALKVIRPEMASRPEILERFKREILLASQVTHKNVLRIHDLGEAGEVRFISMSYVEGTNLKELLEREGPLPLEQGIAYARQIGEALQAAHDAGVVHRDLKPQNILIDRDGNAYIADFGISRSLAEGGTMTDTGAILGTVDYMSPEQARGETPDHRGDIYSFGVILYEMFTGVLPFRASNALSVMMKRLHEDAPSVRKARPDLPAWLSSVIGRAMQRAPEDRYQSAADLLRDIDRRRASRSFKRFARARYLVPAAASILAIILGILATRGIIPLRPRASPASIPRTSLAVLPFRNATGDSSYDWVRTGLPSLVHSRLVDLKSLRLIGQERSEELLATLKFPQDADPGPAGVRRLTSLLGAEHVLSGRLVKIAARLRIEATLQAGNTGLSVEDRAAKGSDGIVVEGQGDQAIFTMVDDLIRHIEDRLGLSRGFLEGSGGASDLTTHSVEALGLYSEGLELARAGNQMEAAKRLEGAVEKDPKFSVARALLAETYDHLGYFDKASAEANRAVAGIGAASSYEAARIRAVQANLSNDTEQALEAYRHLCEIAPNNAEAHFDLSGVQENAGRLEDALQTLKRVVELDPKHPTAHYALGRVHFKLGHQADALQEFTTALALHSETGNDEGRATVLNGFGNAYRGMGKRDDAIKYYRDSLEIRRRIGDRRGVRVVLANLALLQQELGHHEEAIASATEALTIATDMGDREGQSNAYSELGDIYQDSGRPEQALRVYQESLKIVRETDDPVSLSRSLANVGYVSAVLGRYVESYFFLKEALEKRRQVGNKEEIVRSLIDIGLLEQLQGRYEEAVKYQTEALSTARASNNSGGILVAQMNLSNIHEDQGEYGAALSLLADAEKLAREMNDKRLIATCMIYRGSARRHAGDLPGAESALDEGLRLAREMKNEPLMAEALAYRCGLLLARGRRELAAPAARESIGYAKQAADHRLQLVARLYDGEARQSVGDLQAVQSEAQSAGLAPLAASARLALARVHLDAGRARQAGREAALAVQAGTPLHLRDIVFQGRVIAGQTLEMQGQRVSAVEQYRAALGPLEEMRQGLTGDALSGFLGRPELLTYRKEAGRLFHDAQHSADADRLETLLRP